MFTSLLRGIAIGLITGMPVGPIGALCLKNTLNFGKNCGLVSGLGSSFADSIYAVIAVLSIFIVQKFIVVHGFIFKTAGGMILIFFGIYIYFKESGKKSLRKRDMSIESSFPNQNPLFKAFTSTFLLALANPATIFSFIAVFTGLRFAHVENGPNSKILLVIGVFIGSLLWWIAIVFTASSLSKKITVEHTNKINKILNFIIIACGILILLSAFHISDFFGHDVMNIHRKLFRMFFNTKPRMPMIPGP